MIFQSTDIFNLLRHYTRRFSEAQTFSTYYLGTTQDDSLKHKHFQLTKMSARNVQLHLEQGRACFNVQWCTKWAVMNDIAQWWKAIFAVMNHEEIKATLIYWYVRVESFV